MAKPCFSILAKTSARLSYARSICSLMPIEGGLVAIKANERGPTVVISFARGRVFNWPFFIQRDMRLTASL